jgi:hypothetical protein
VNQGFSVTSDFVNPTKIWGNIVNTNMNVEGLELVFSTILKAF